MDRMWLRTPSGVVLLFSLPLDEYIDRQWRDGTLTRVNEDGSAYAEGDEYAIVAGGDHVEGTVTAGEMVVAPAVAAEITADPKPEVTEPMRPAANAPKRDWVAYAVTLGVCDEAEAKAMNKVDLVKVCTPPEMQPADPGE